jgi:tripeptide aminopeptidase
MGRIDEATTANVGTIEGVGPTNVVAPQARVAGECRSLHRQSVENVRSQIDQALEEAAASFGGAVNITWHLEYEGFNLPTDTSAVDTMREACSDVGLVPVTFSTGGGSDANIIAALGVPTLALSCGMTGVHGVQEEILVADLEKLFSLCVAAGRRLAL